MEKRNSLGEVKVPLLLQMALLFLFLFTGSTCSVGFCGAPTPHTAGGARVFPDYTLPIVHLLASDFFLSVTFI